MRRFGAALILILAGHAPPAASGGSLGDDTVSLGLSNEADGVLRCTAIIAHFLSEDLGAVAPGGRIELTFRRSEDGGLALGTFDGKPMWVENIRCGLDTRWTETATDIPLDVLRTADVKALSAACSATRSNLACTVTAVE